ncbi:helix-turn-helix domain-containing protein [Nocardia transvalensis]|uniref:helix-turn-helix domain-containing protein n=1 Tax=Nocardia transvalensis TaxID=37333 RepID=UPI0018946F17|nr:helix-turn-helix transcriptional regulator [Nocardia transvalensis]MBF6328763.1 helix-turn-helix transcriptional regulator [Nocardia transvalensis]
MILKDRKKLARLMAIEEVSQRDLAQAAGYRAHSYIGRLLRGEVDGLGDEPAARIARRLQVSVEDLFLPESTSNYGQSDLSGGVGGGVTNLATRPIVPGTARTPV